MAVQSGERGGLVGLGEKAFAGGDRTGAGDWASKMFDPAGIFEGTPQASNPNFDTSLGLNLSGNVLDAMGQRAQNRQIDPAVYEMLLAQSQGGPGSAAHALLNQGVERGQSAAMSLAASNPNVSPALAQRLAQNASSEIGIQGRQEGVQLQQQGQQALAGYVLQQQALNDALTQFYMQQGFSRAEAELKARMELSAQQVQVDVANVGAEQTQRGAAAGVFGTVLGGLTGGGGKK